MSEQLLFPGFAFTFHVELRYISHGQVSRGAFFPLGGYFYLDLAWLRSAIKHEVFR